MNKRQTGIVPGMKMFFGIFMVLVYLGAAVALALNLVQWTETPRWNAIRWGAAIIFGAYGLYRGYREVKGEHSYGMRTYDDAEEEDQYTTYADSLKNKEGESKNEE